MIRRLRRVRATTTGPDRVSTRPEVVRAHRKRIRLIALSIGFLTWLLLPLHAFADPITQTVVDDSLNAITQWVADGASWVLAQVVAIVQQGTAVDLSGAWFQQHYATMIALACLVMVPLLVASAAKAAFTGNAGLAIKAGFLLVPLAFFGIFVAIQVVNELLQIVDWASATMSTTLNADYQKFAQNIATGLNGGNGNSVAAPFVIFICAIFMVVFGLLVFIELLFRNAAIYAVAVFIPLAMATVVFPSTATIAKRLIETLFGLILLKFFIVAVLSVGVSALAAQGNGGGFGTVLAGIVVLILAAVLPNLLIGLLPLVEGAAIATIAARTTSQQIIQPTSTQIYAGIRRQNEQRITGGASGALLGGAAAGGGGAALLGAASARHGHAPSAGVVGGGLPGVGSPGPGAATVVGGGTGASAGAPSAEGAVLLGGAAITGFSAKRVGGGTASTVAPPAAPV